MANNVHCSQAFWNAALKSGTAGACTLLDGGTINLYTTPQPATPDTAITSQTLLATLTFSSPAFGSSSAGVATANAITSGSGITGGTAVWARMCASGGAAEVDCTVGTTGCDINLNTNVIVTGTAVALSALTIAMPTGQ